MRKIVLIGGMVLGAGVLFGHADFRQLVSHTEKCNAV